MFCEKYGDPIKSQLLTTVLTLYLYVSSVCNRPASFENVHRILKYLQVDFHIDIPLVMICLVDKISSF